MPYMCPPIFIFPLQEHIRADISEEELMSTDLLPLSHVEDNTTDKEKTAVIYFMLKDKVEKNTISTICNYVAGKSITATFEEKIAIP